MWLWSFGLRTSDFVHCSDTKSHFQNGDTFRLFTKQWLKDAEKERLFAVLLGLLVVLIVLLLPIYFTYIKKKGL